MVTHTGHMGLHVKDIDRSAEFFAQIVRPSLPRFFQRVECFVSFFKQHRRQRRVSLFTVPGTAAR